MLYTIDGPENMPNYPRLLKTAQRIISDAGRTVTFVQLSVVDDNPAAPWRGTAAPRTVPTATLVKKAVFVEPDSNQRNGEMMVTDDLLKRIEKICIVAGSDNLDGFNEIIDSDNTRWKIEFTHKLQPGDIIMCYYVGVKR